MVQTLFVDITRPVAARLLPCRKTLGFIGPVERKFVLRKCGERNLEAATTASRPTLRLLSCLSFESFDWSHDFAKHRSPLQSRDQAHRVLALLMWFTTSLHLISSGFSMLIRMSLSICPRKAALYQLALWWVGWSWISLRLVPRQLVSKNGLPLFGHRLLIL